MTRLSIIGDRTKEVVLEGKDEEILRNLTSALLLSRTSGKSTYASWIRRFDEGAGRYSDMVVEAMLPYWVVLVHPTKRTRGGGQLFYFPDGHPPCERREVGLSTHIHWLFVRECFENIARSAGTYGVVTHSGTGFLQILLCNHS